MTPAPCARTPCRTACALAVALTLAWWGMPSAFAALSVFGDPAPATRVPAAPPSPSGSGSVREVFELNAQIKQRQQRLGDIRAKIERYRQSIVDAQSKSRTLRNQLGVLEDRVARKALAIEEATTQREQVELEIRATRLELDGIRSRTDRQRVLIGALLTELRFATRDDPFAAILLRGSIGEYLAARQRIALLQRDLRRVLGELRLNDAALSASERTLQERQTELQALGERLADERTALAEEQGGKARLLAATRENEGRYQQMLADLKREQGQIDADIVALDAKVRERLTAIDAEFGKTGRVAFSWPVPNRGITAYFHDPEYPFRNVFEHPAIDIRAGQGSPIAAAAPGYVARAKDGGYGYSYIMLIHPGGFATVYGHVSQINVREDTYVTRGQIIGLTGGRPGTRGAGNLTTGPHLHFEVRLNGIPVNPLNYLL